MKKLYYDFHIHSCLSPCGDDDMTPNNIAGMGKLNGMDIMALTDHNSCLNCPAFFDAAQRYGIIPIAGAEVTTAEDIHLVCLFRELSAALEFSQMLDGRRPAIKNKAAIFGRQLILDSEDNITGEKENLLINASDITVEQLPAIVRSYDGICYPAHIDRQSNGIIATLGVFPEESDFRFAEFNDISNKEEYLRLYPALKSMELLTSSDAHYLENMPDAAAYLTLEGETQEEIVKSLFDYFGKI